jgi:hypothetical protein
MCLNIQHTYTCRYIFGKNASSEKIPMTTPVFTQASDGTLSDVSIQIVLPMNKDLNRYIQGFRSQLQVPLLFLVIDFPVCFATFHFSLLSFIFLGCAFLFFFDKVNEGDIFNNLYSITLWLMVFSIQFTSSKYRSGYFEEGRRRHCCSKKIQWTTKRRNCAPEGKGSTLPIT